MAKADPMFERVIKTLPREKLDEYAKDYAGNERPWASTRQELENSLIACGTDFRNDLAEWVSEQITRAR